MSSLDDIMQRLTSIDNRLGAIERLLTADQPNAARPQNRNGSSTPNLSPTEYILRLKPSSDVERTVVFANFLEEYRHLASFSSDDIGALFVEARLKKPSNVADKIGKNASKGLFMPAGDIDGKKTWKLTLNGQAYMKELENDRK